MKDFSRREFIQGTIAAGAGLSLAGSVAAQKPFTRVIGANDDVRVAVIGFNGQGQYHIRNLQNVPGVRIVALCDTDEKVLAGEQLKGYLKNNFGEEETFREHGEEIKTYTDARHVFDRKDIDAVIIATPDHWHALLGIWACQAGKDAYIEKPVSHHVWEGFKLVEASRKYNRIVASGTQRRSDIGMPEVVEYLRSGELGEIKIARSLGYGPRPDLGYMTGPQPIPKTVDYNLWCGPLATNPLMRERLHYIWRFFWDPGSGDLPNNGVHFVDLCRWILDYKELVLSSPVMSFGGRFLWDDCGQVPNTQYAVWDTKPVPMTCEIQNLPRKTGDPAHDHVKGVRMGMVIECEGGMMAGGWAYDKDGKKIRSFPRDHGSGHMANFIKAVRSQKRSDLNADILEGHLSSSMCILSNISYRVGRAMAQEQVRESIQANSDALRMYEQFSEHIAANGIDTATATVGPWLKLDVDKMRIITDDPTAELIANALFKRHDRPPFVVPDKV
jgi:hypothetical protein